MKAFIKKPSIQAIIYLSCLAVVMNIIRLFLAGNDAYVWLNWNLALALLPLGFAYIAITSNYRFLWFIGMCCWLGFLPNAPYLLTDFIHLADVGPRSLLWFDALMMFTYSLVGVMVYLVSLRMIMQRFRWVWYGPVVIGLMTGFGIYLGRYIRFNSWHVLTQPLDILKVLGEIIMYPRVHEPFVTVTVTFAIFLTSLYFISSRYLLYEKTLD